MRITLASRSSPRRPGVLSSRGVPARASCPRGAADRHRGRGRPGPSRRAHGSGSVARAHLLGARSRSADFGTLTGPRRPPDSARPPLLRGSPPIGAPGFEPGTSAPQTRRSDQAELRPVAPGAYATPKRAQSNSRPDPGPRPESWAAPAENRCDEDARSASSSPPCSRSWRCRPEPPPRAAQRCPGASRDPDRADARRRTRRDRLPRQPRAHEARPARAAHERHAAVVRDRLRPRHGPPRVLRARVPQRRDADPAHQGRHPLPRRRPAAGRSARTSPGARARSPRPARSSPAGWPARPTARTS